MIVKPDIYHHLCFTICISILITLFLLLSQAISSPPVMSPPKLAMQRAYEGFQWYQRQDRTTGHQRSQWQSFHNLSRDTLSCKCWDIPTNSGENSEGEEAGLNIIPVVGELLGHNIHPCRGSRGTGQLIGGEGRVKKLEIKVNMSGILKSILATSSGCGKETLISTLFLLIHATCKSQIIMILTKFNFFSFYPLNPSTIPGNISLRIKFSSNQCSINDKTFLIMIFPFQKKRHAKHQGYQNGKSSQTNLLHDTEFCHV